MQHNTCTSRSDVGALLHLLLRIRSSASCGAAAFPVCPFPLHCPAITTTTMAKSTPGAEKASSAHLALRMLNKASVKTGGTWEVIVWNPIVDKYEYTWQGKTRQGTNFLCNLVSPDDRTCYLQAQFKKTSTNGTKYQEALETYVTGARFVMSNVSFVEDAKTAYVSCPLKSIVDLSKTKMEACVGASDSAVQPAPTATVAGSTDLGTNQFFDVTALIQEVKEVREHDNNRSSFLVNIHDGSVDSETQKIKSCH